VRHWVSALSDPASYMTLAPRGEGRATLSARTSENSRAHRPPVLDGTGEEDHECAEADAVAAGA